MRLVIMHTLEKAYCQFRGAGLMGTKCRALIVGVSI